MKTPEIVGISAAFCGAYIPAALYLLRVDDLWYNTQTMVTYPVQRRTRPSVTPSTFQVLAALAGGAALFIVFMTLLVVGSNLAYARRVYPGVWMAGVDLSGLTPEQAGDALAQKLAFPARGQIVLQDKDQVWAVRPADLGLSMDVAANAQAAYLLGRSGNLFQRLGERMIAWHSGMDLSPRLVYDERLAQAYLTRAASMVDRPTVEASLSVNGLDVLAVPGQIGRQVDISATLSLVGQQMSSLTDGVVPLVVKETPPEIMDASQQAQEARQLLSAPLTLALPDAQPGEAGPWVIPPSQLAGMLTVERVQSPDGTHYQVGLKDEALYTYLTSLAADIDRGPQNARFMFNDDTRKLEVIKPAVTGRNLDVYATIREINQNLAKGQHSAALTLVYTKPDVGDDATGEQLGITEQIIAYTSYFRGSTAERLQNIETAAANFHGLLVPPGATFSMASAMGSVSLDTGYAEALIIYGGRTIKGVGGGVCQVSTTLFRAAFFAGFPVVERYPHAYRVGYYEQTSTGWDENLAGLDATVFVPVVDLKFVNNTPYWLLMETYFHPNSRSLTWKFYSTSDGRRVEWETTGPQNIVDPPDPVYEENPELAQGVIKQVDWAAEGADVTVTRIVYLGDQVLFSDTFTTHYMPWSDVYQYGPGTELPKAFKPKKKR
jgi:vancomycin resistance protein YoaR